MSGSSHGYLYRRVESDADETLRRTADDSPARRHREWFAEHLRLVAKAMHDIEWVDSCDYGRGDEVKAIEAVRAHCTPEAVDAEARQRLRDLAARIYALAEGGP